MFITFFLILLLSNAMDSVLQALQTAQETFFENTLRNLATKVDAQRHTNDALSFDEGNT